MGKNGTFLLDDGDELQLSETVTLVYRSFGAVKQSVLTATQEREKAILSSRYLVTGRLLGEGAYGKVLIGVDQNTQRQLACKVVNLEKLYDRRADLRMPTSDGQWSSSQAVSRLPPKVQSCFREFDILKDLSHPNIVHVQKVFWSRSTIYMFQELVTGGDLFSYIEYKHGKIPSIESAVIIRQVLKGVQYLHDQDIVHRDLKPDNVLMTSLDSGARVVITDFGNARFLPNANIQNDFVSNKLKRMFSMVGTLEYTAPEIHRMNEAIPSAYGYSLSVDMWSIGSITAAILTGEQIFSCRQNNSFEEDARCVIVGLAAQCDLSVLDDEYHPLWGPVGPAPKDFIRRLLVLEEEDRMSAAEALNHFWFTHPMMAGEFEAQYERSIRDWRPRRKDDQLIEQISTFGPSSVPQKALKGNPVDGIASRFFASKQAPTQAIPTDEYQRTDESQADDQFASQSGPSSYGDRYAGDEAQQLYQTEGCTQFDERYDAALNRNLDEQQTYVEPVADNRPTPQTKKYVGSSKVVAGQLQRVSASTRGRYFQREIVDLDDLDGPMDESDETMDTVQSTHMRTDHAHPRGTIHQEETIQVRTTPSADSEAHGGVDQWWHHRYPPTQYYYDIQAEPITQEGDDVLVQETPPEIFLKPTNVSRDGCTFEQRHVHQQVHETPFAHKVSKQKKVYGRQR